MSRPNTVQELESISNFLHSHFTELGLIETEESQVVDTVLLEEWDEVGKA
jgi:hypothetical protein